MQKRYIFGLLFVLILVWIVNDLRQARQVEFEKTFEYSFVDKPFQEIEEELNLEDHKYMRARSANAQILSLINMMEWRHFLMYQNRFSLKKYYDFIKVMLYPDLRYQLKNKKKYTDEIGKFLRRKRKMRIKYLKYEVSLPVVSKKGTDESAEVYVVRTTKGEKEYFKYDFKKYNDGRFYLYLDSKILPNQLKFKFKESEKEQ